MLLRLTLRLHAFYKTRLVCLFLGLSLYLKVPGKGIVDKITKKGSLVSKLLHSIAATVLDFKSH
jgi:hypothetical protein